MKPSDILNHLVKLGRIRYVAIREKKPKMTKKAVKVIFLCNMADCAQDVYCCNNPKRKRIIESRDVAWAERHGVQEVLTSAS